MKIYFSPEYSGTVYTGLSADDNIRMDATVVDTAGLVGLLELRAGIHYEEVSRHHRTALYYKAMKQYMAEHPDNLLSDSFKLSGLGTAGAALAWRDELLMDQWSPQEEAPSERIAVLCGIEPLFTGAPPSLAERINRLIETLRADEGISCADYELVLPCSAELLHPLTRKLADAMVAKGAVVSQIEEAADDGSNLSKIRNMLRTGGKEKITLDPTDHSFLVYRFPNETKADEYMAYRSDKEEADLWINGNNKMLDNWLMLMGKPAAGSTCSDAAPQVVQLLVYGVKLTYPRLNISTLIDWLYAPVHPLPARFKYALAGAVISEGGYRNDKCRGIIDKYIEGGYEKPDDSDAELDEKAVERKRKKLRKEREEKVEIFLPPLERSDEEDVDGTKLRRLVSNLGTWARQRAVMAGAEQELWTEQLGLLAGLCDTLLILIDAEATPRLKTELLDTWLHSLNQPMSFTQYVAQKGCRTLIDSPMKMAAKAAKTVWLNIDLSAGRGLDCDFLYPSEYEKASGKLTMYSHDNENRYISRMEMLPVMLTQKQLIITLCDRRAGKASPKPPLMVRLENLVTNIGDFIVHPDLREELSRCPDVVRTDNGGSLMEIKIDNANLIKEWPALSPTTISTLVLHPFDYVLEYLIRLNADGPGQLSEVKTTKGNVAHAVIEALFSPRNGETVAYPQDIKERIEAEYDKTVDEQIEACGAILNLEENLLEGKSLKEQLRPCIDNLVGILADNGLRVTACERKVQCNMGLLDKADGNDMHSRIDMTAVDATGTEVVIDFKWTDSQKYYQDLLRENRSVQLALYRHILATETGRDVKHTAYFLMPRGRLYSTMPFKGKNCEKIACSNTNDIVEQVVNSFRYRKEQIENGIIEMGEGQPASGLSYFKDTMSKNLFPLEMKDSDTKDFNIFTQYSSFYK